MRDRGNSTGVEVRVLEEHELAKFGERIAAVEKNITYPLGDDSFRVDHGADYFAFFRRMGELRYLVATKGEELLGMLAAIRRDLPKALGGPAWYLGDLKLDRPGRGLLLARQLLSALRREAGPRQYFGVSMNPAGASDRPGSTSNRVALLIDRLFPEARVAGTLNFYTLAAAEMREHRTMIEEHRGPIRFVSLCGMKDIVLTSTGRPMPLLHVQHGQLAASKLDGCGDVQADHQHMFCCPKDDELDRAVRAAGIPSTATASILHADLDGDSNGPGAGTSAGAAPDVDWSFILTSDI